MTHNSINNQDAKQVTQLFTAVFTASEGFEEGKLIGKLVSELARNIDNKEIFCFGAYNQERLVGSIFFTRLRFAGAYSLYMLAPVAVRAENQGKGIGQSLINYGIKEMKNQSVAAVVTYGDPCYYSKVGFQPLSESVIQAPFALTMPEGWQGQSLTNDPIPTINERPICVKEFNDPSLW